MGKPETMMIDDVKYVREDSIKQQAEKVDGLEYAIIRTRMHGVVAGYVKSYKQGEITVLNSRRIWYFKGCQTLEEMAVYGTTDIENCNITPVAPKTTIVEDFSIIYASEKCRKQIAGIGH